MLNLFIGQYKNEKILIKFNMVRYTTMCIVLDYYCYMNSLNEDMACTFDCLVDFVFQKSSLNKTEKHLPIVHTAIINMKMIGMLYEPRSGYLAITDKGKQTYMSQSYHSTAANLYQANASRKLSIVAIGVAIAGVILTLILQLIESNAL